MKPLYSTCLLLLFFFAIVLFHSCSKGGGGGTTPNPCSGITVTVNGTVTNPSSSASSDGSIGATATGGSGFTFNINGGSFQSSGNFSNLGVGSYTITAKNSNGCTGSATFNLSPANLCAGVVITVSATATSNTPCQPANNGSITVTASGGAGTLTYSLDGGAFQASNVFSTLNAGNYMVTAKDANGCTGSTNVTVNTTAAGPLFTAVRTLIQNNCALAGCHGDVQAPIFLSSPCVIVSNATLIKARAVDGNPTPMPPTGLLPPSERQKIADWVAAGGQYTN